MIDLPPLDARIPAWNFDDLVDRVCPVCGHDGAEPRFRRPDRLVVRRCSGCTTWFVSPAPSAAQLDAFYARYDDQHCRNAREPGAPAGLGLSIVHLKTVGFSDLAGIDRPRRRERGVGEKLKDVLRAMPGFTALNRLRRGLAVGGRNERDGVYGLFALLEKPRS